MRDCRTDFDIAVNNRKQGMRKRLSSLVEKNQQTSAFSLLLSMNMDDFSDKSLCLWRQTAKDWTEVQVFFSLTHPGLKAGAI
jgi:hypothetical protein